MLLTVLGTLDSIVAYPDEQIGYLASEQYASRSQLSSPNYLAKMQSNVSQPPVESPLRKTSFPADDIGYDEFHKSRSSLSGKSDDVVESEYEDEIIHIDAPRRHYNKITGGEETMHETEELRPYMTHQTDEGGLVDEHGYSVSILASDEVAKSQGGEDMRPAISPTPDHRTSHYDPEYRGSGDVTPTSRPTSRPGSIHGIIPSLSRFTSRHEDYREDMHTPLEDVDEYEPLFPDEDSKKKAISAAERFKPRPGTLKHRFPSQDIWEDTPNSAMHIATVSTPEPSTQVESAGAASSSKTFESPEMEAARKGEATQEERKKLVPREERLAKSRFAPHLRDDMPTRPGLQPRFPSQDIWEDSPDSYHLVATVSSSGEDVVVSPTEASSSKPTIPPRPNKSRLGDGTSSHQFQPDVPARPQKRVHAVPPADGKLSDISVPPNQQSEKGSSPTDLRKVPSLPDRPKPQVPARPAKKPSAETLSKTISATSTASGGSTETEKGVPFTSPPAAKAKPQVPARPGQSMKIANLKGNFMNDLNQRLQLGPPKEKEPEQEPELEKETKPLEDARKGRARGPQRRAPAKSPASSAEVASTSAEKKVNMSLSTPRTVWHINSADGALTVHIHDQVHSMSDAKPASAELAKSQLKNDAPIEMSEDKVAQMEHSTPTGATIGTVAEGTRSEGTAEPKEAKASGTKSEDTPPASAPDGLALNTAGEAVDPSPVTTPQTELPNPMEKFQEKDYGAGSLSTQTTASSGAVSGHTLDRVRAAEHGPSLSRQTTASSEASGATLEEQKTSGNYKPTKFRSEQVSAAAPAPGSEGLTEGGSNETKVAGGAVDETKGDAATSGDAGPESPEEPMTEKDVNYKKLEEMTAMADGKGHAPEEGS